MAVKQADTIHRTLRHRIIRGELAPHSRLIERDLAKDFGCSRIPVREAVHRLERDGLLAIRPGWGAYVRHLSKDEWEQAQEVRAVLEGLVFSIVAQKRPAKVLRRLAEIVEDMREAAERGDGRAEDELDLKFHEMLVDATGNQWLMEMHPRVAAPMVLLSLYVRPTREMLLEGVAEHEQVLKVLWSGDVAAARAAGQNHRPNIADPSLADWEGPPVPSRKKQ